MRRGAILSKLIFNLLLKYDPCTEQIDLLQRFCHILFLTFISNLFQAD